MGRPKGSKNKPKLDVPVIGAGQGVNVKQLGSIEDYLIDLLNQKYAKRVMQKMNTEWEKLTIERGSEPGASEYEWMVKRALEIHRELNITPGKEKAV